MNSGILKCQPLRWDMRIKSGLCVISSWLVLIIASVNGFLFDTESSCSLCFTYRHKNLSLLVCTNCLHRLNLTHCLSFSLQFFSNCISTVFNFSFPAKATLFPFWQLLLWYPKSYSYVLVHCNKLIPNYIPLPCTRCLSPNYLVNMNRLCICLILNNTSDQMLKH